MEKRRFSLYARARKRGRPIYYCRFRKKDGTWGPGRSTGCTSEPAARGWAEARIESGKIPAAPGDCPTLAAWIDWYSRGTHAGSTINLPLLAAMLAAGCGLRHVEILALRPADIRGSVLMVHRAWNTAAGDFRKPKWDSIREVPLPPRLQAELDDYISEKGLAAEALLFPGPDPYRPIAQASIVPAVREALEAIGIPKEEQAPSRRYLDLHSLRHTSITRLRAGDVPGWRLQRAAGHRSGLMTDKYTHARAEDLRAAAEGGARILPFRGEKAS